jgi:hypothetical protein
MFDMFFVGLVLFQSVDDREVELAKQKHNLPSFLKTTIATEAGEELDKWKATHFFACFDRYWSTGWFNNAFHAFLCFA